MKVAIFDYGAGNLHSLSKALEACGAKVRISTDPVGVLDTGALVLPGVGAFGPAAACLAPGREAVRKALEGGLPCLGICLGMQLLFEGSDEGAGEGLGVFRGRATRLTARRVPQIGWNGFEPTRDPAFKQARLEAAYYAHSFACRPTDPGTVVAWSEHEGDRFAAAVRRDRCLGVQFHPEKSSSGGLALVHAWLAEAAR